MNRTALDTSAPGEPAVQVVPASSAQQRFWVLDQLDPAAAAYTMPMARRLVGVLDAAALGAAFNAIVARHEVLRTVFALEGEEPVQLLLPTLSLDVPTIDLSAQPPLERIALMRDAIDAEANRPFDLAHGPLIRASLLRLAADEHVLLINLHHIVADGWSVGILFHELEECYAASTAGRVPDLASLPLQYADYAIWQRRMLETQAAKKQLVYWTGQLAAPLPVLELLTDRPRPATQTTHGSKRELLVPAETVEGVRGLARRQGVTPFMAFLGAFFAMLHRYTGQDDLIVGSITAGRQRAELESLIGLFVNTVALRVDTSGDPTFVELLLRVRQATTSAMANQDVPFEEVAEALGAGRDRSRSPVFQVAFQLLESITTDLRLPGLVVERVPAPKDTAKFELTLMLHAAPDGALRAVMEYNTDLYDGATIDRMLTQYRTLLAAIVRDPAVAISRLTLLPAAEYATVVNEWNSTTAAYPAGRCVHDCVSEQALRTPSAIAVEMGARRMTFAELDRRSNRVAHRLRALGVTPGVGVGVFLERSPELIVALLAVLKAGGHYVPLAADYPADRIAFMRDDARLAVLLASASQSPPPGDAAVLHLDEALSEFADASDIALDAQATAEDPAYVIYTSGSTGRPKGVVVPHRAVVNYIHWMRTAFPHDTSDAVLQKAPVSFDASVWELYLPLFTGARMVLARAGGASDASYLVDALQQHAITTVQFVPSQLQVLLEVGGLERCAGLRRLFCGGEALPAELLGRLAGLLPRVEVTNLYGPTETTVYSTRWTLARAGFDGSAPIGRPIANTQVYVLDPALQPAPIGVAGELYIAGAGVALGYLDREALTTERFVANPFARDDRARMYRTGDRVRWRADGELEYLGRVDHQVKLRGHRIELGEVETALAQHPGVSAAAAVIREDLPGDKRLVAYVVASGQGDLGPAALREYLRQSLPEIMVPSAVVVLERLPLNANGKLDRAALPPPEASALATDAAAYVAPRTPLEIDIATAWAGVLGLERVGVDDDFFDLGGHSLAAMRVLARLTGRVPEAVTLGAILKVRTVAGLAALIEAMPAGDTAGPIARRTAAGPAPLSHSQQLIWLFEQMIPGLATYNVPMVRRIRGSIDFDALRHSVDAVVARHEILRTTFEEVDGEARQVVQPAMPAQFEVVDLRGTNDGQAEGVRVLQREAAKPFDLATGPLLRVVAVRLGDDGTLLLIVTHHIAFDGASVGILMRDLSVSYDARRGRAVTALPSLPIQFADYAAWERETSHDERLASSLEYWRSTLDGAPGSLDLPTDRPRGASPSGPGARHVANYPAELGVALGTLARQHDATLFMVLLAAFQSLLHRYSGQDDIVVGSPIAGRMRPEIQDLIGYFANTLALRARFDDDLTFAAQLARVRQTCLDAYEHQDVSYEKLVLDLRPRRSPADAALFSVMFVLQDGDTARLQLGDAEVMPAPVDVGAAKFDLSFSIAETAAGLRVSVEYRADLFDAATIERMAGHFQFLLERIVEAPTVAISRLPILTSAERRQVIEDFNATSVAYPAGETLVDLLDAQAMCTPDAIAVVDETETLTFAELHSRADAVARWLGTQGAGPGSLIGVCLERSVALAVALVGVLKAGAAYVPIDPDYPPERLAFMLDDAGVPVLLTQQRLAASLPGYAGVALAVDSEWDRIVAVPPTVATRRPSPNDAVYMIYTSGSTGRPKGVLNSHRGVANNLRWMWGEYRLTPADVVLQKAATSFDVSVWEVFLPLTTGARLVMARPGGHRDPNYLADLIHAHGVTVLEFVPSMLHAFLEEPGVTARCASLRDVLSGGEPLSGNLARHFFRVLPGARLHNLYGPTETTIGVSSFRCSMDDDRNAVPIGRPIANTRFYVLDRHLAPVPIGVPGELYIAGAQVGLGYHRRPDSTARRFVPEPFVVGGQDGMYRTGDRVRWLVDGTLEFLGRLDLQVKLRGQRIELEEIESVISTYPSVRAATVRLCDLGARGAVLVAYFVPGVPGQVDIDELRTHLRRALPPAMVPSAFVRLDAMPTTTSGKVDRTALPIPSAADLAADFAIVAPETAAEEVVAGIWADVLGVAAVSVEADFFDIGGHSLLATQVVSRLARLFRTQVSLRSFFEHPTVRDIVVALTAAEGKPGQTEAIARALLKLRQMSPDERRQRRDVAATATTPGQEQA